MKQTVAITLSSSIEKEMQCRYGKGCRNPNCTFLHPGKDVVPAFDTSKIPCVHYKKGRCNKGAECKFLHDDGQQRSPMSNVWIAPSPKAEPPPEPMRIVEPSDDSGPYYSSDEEMEPASVEPPPAPTVPDQQPSVPEQSPTIPEKPPEPAQEVLDVLEADSFAMESEPLSQEPAPIPQVPEVEQSVQSPLTEVLVPDPPKAVLRTEVEPPPAAAQKPPEQVLSTSQRIVALRGPKLDSTKIIALPNSKPPEPPKTNATKMARQQRPMAEIQIKTLEQIKREKEELRSSKDKSPASPAPGNLTVTRMQRVTRVPAKSKADESPAEPLPVKRPKVDEELQEFVPVEDMKKQVSPTQSQEEVSKEINDIISEESRMAGESARAVEEMAEAMLAQPDTPPPEVPQAPASLPVSPAVFPIPALFPVASPAAAEEREVGEVLEAGEVVEVVSTPVKSAPQYAESPPATETEVPVVPEPPAPVAKERPKPKPPVAPTAPKTVISLPSMNKHSAAPGEILTLEEIKRRKQLKEQADKPVTPLPEKPVSPLPDVGQKRKRDPEPAVREALPFKHPKPAQPKPSPAQIESLGDWEPLSVALKALDFSTVEGSSEDDVAHMKELAQRMSTPQGFFELLDELEEKVTEMEVSSGLSPEDDQDFLVRIMQTLSLEQQIDYLYAHSSA